MEVAGLAIAERQGATLEYRAERRHPQAQVLIALLTPPGGGRPAAVPAGGGRPSPEDALVDSLVASHTDESVALALPAALWRQREQIDFRRLTREATRRNERQSLGLLLQLTGRLGGDRRLMLRAAFLRDRRRTVMRPFFTSGTEPSGNPLPLARRWGYLLGIGLDRFAQAFRPKRRRARG